VELGRRDPVLHSPLIKPKKITEAMNTDIEIPEKILVRNVSLKREILMDVTIQTAENTIKTKALLDSGANDTFVDRKWAEQNGLPLRHLERPIPVFNVDGTKNQGGNITHATEFTMDYNGHTELVQAEVTDLGRTSVIIGYTWLVRHNPTIDWSTGRVTLSRCPATCGLYVKQKKEINWTEVIQEIQGYKLLREVYTDKPKDKTPEELVPKAYHDYLSVFSKKASERMPIKKTWDHAIDMKEGFVPKKGRMIPLSYEEQQEVNAFIDEQLAKGYIRPSKSEQTSPVFFVPKMDGKKCMKHLI
jgi:hypothetical protein